MAHIHHFPRHKYQPSMLESVGQKVKTVAEIAGAAKGIWDIGRMIYTGAQTLGPALGVAATLL